VLRPRAGWRRLAGRLAGLGVVGYLAVLTVNRSLVTVRGPSMEPALWEGDRLLTVPAWRGAIVTGRVVVVRDPGDPGHLVVKRVHALVYPGGATPGRRELVEVRGDAPDRSTDSRAWGPVPVSAVRRLVLRRWPDLRTRLSRPEP
jgi:signal peptidase I